MEKKVFQKKDLWVILPFLAVALCIALFYARMPSSSKIAVVEKDGKEFCRIDLDKETSVRIINVGGPMNVKLRVEPGAIAFYSSDCPDKICIRTGKLTKPGQTAVCLPGKVSVQVVSGNGEKSYDGYTG
jgi:hypothetical protein